MNETAGRRLSTVVDSWNTLRGADVELEARLRDLEPHPQGHARWAHGGFRWRLVAAVAFDLILEVGMSSPSCDATTRDGGRRVEIKATQRSSCAFRNPSRHEQPAYVVLLAIDKDGGWEACWHGDGTPPMRCFRHDPAVGMASARFRDPDWRNWNKADGGHCHSPLMPSRRCCFPPQLDWCSRSRGRHFVHGRPPVLEWPRPARPRA